MYVMPFKWFIMQNIFIFGYILLIQMAQSI